MNNISKYGIGALMVGGVIMLDQFLNKKRVKYYPSYILKIEELIGKPLNEINKDIIVDRVAGISLSVKGSWAYRVYKRLIKGDFSRVYFEGNVICFVYKNEDSPFMTIRLK